MRPKGVLKMQEGYISNGEAEKMLGICRLTVCRLFGKGILAGEQHPITNSHRI